jgi:hypothetical protein
MKPMQIIDEATLDRILADLAAERGITRAQLEAEIEHMRADASGDEHLTFEEALGVGTLRPERLSHWESCPHCKELAQTLAPTSEEVAAFVNTARPRWYKRSAVAAIAALSLLAVFLFKPLLRSAGANSHGVTDSEPVTAPKELI